MLLQLIQTHYWFTLEVSQFSPNTVPKSLKFEIYIPYTYFTPRIINGRKVNRKKKFDIIKCTKMSYVTCLRLAR